MVGKGKHSSRSWKTLKHQGRKLNAICTENRKRSKKQMKNKCVNTGVNVGDQNIIGWNKNVNMNIQ